MNLNERFLAYWQAVECHKGCIDLGMGMPQPLVFQLDKDLQPALIEGIKHQADYQPQAGSQGVRQAIADYESTRTGIKHAADNIMLTAGALRGFSLVIDYLATPATQFVEVVPTYPLLSGHIRNTRERLKCKLTTIVPKDNAKFEVHSDEIVSHIKKPSIIFVTNPSNPTGLYLSSNEIETTLKVCEQNGSYVVVDETCDVPLTTTKRLLYKSSPALIRIQSFSKNLLLAGYRAGYVVANETLIKSLAEHYSFSDGNAPVVFNNAILRYFQNPQRFLKNIIGAIKPKLRLTVEMLKEVPAVTQVIEPEACYYMFVKVNFEMSSWCLFEYLLERGVNILPGELFGMKGSEGWIRICFGREEADLVEGLSRITKALASAIKCQPLKTHGTMCIVT